MIFMWGFYILKKIEINKSIEWVYSEVKEFVSSRLKKNWTLTDFYAVLEEIFCFCFREGYQKIKKISWR